MRSTRIVVVAVLALLVGVAAAAAAVALVGDDGERAADTAATGTSEPLSGPEVRFSGIDVTTGAVVSLDGEDQGTAPLESPFESSAGRHSA